MPAFNPAASAAALGTRTPRLLPHLASLTFIGFAPFGYTKYIHSPVLSSDLPDSYPLGTAGVPPAVRLVLKTLAGDRVIVEMSPYDLEKGRIIFRHKDDRAGSVARPPARQQFRRR